MKTKRGAIAVLTTLLMVTPFFGTMADTTTKPHNVRLRNLTIVDLDESNKIIYANSGSQLNIQIVLPTEYTVNTTRKTQLRRGSGEKALFSEFLTGDTITVWGKTTDGTTISATKVKDESIRKIKGKYLATIADIAPADIDFGNGIQGEFLAIRGNDSLVITLSYGYTKIRDSRNHRIAYTDLQTGDVVQLQGIARTFGPFTEVYNTALIKVKSHEEAPTNFLPNFFKINR